MSILTDCDIREQWKWSKNINKVLLSWSRRDFQKDEQDGKLFNQEKKLDKQYGVRYVDLVPHWSSGLHYAVCVWSLKR